MRMFSNFSKALKVSVVIIFTIFIIAASFIIGWVVRPLPEYVPVQTDNQHNDTQPAGNVGEKSVLQDTQVTWIYSFAACGDELDKMDNSAVLGLTVDEIRKLYPECTVSENTDGSVEIYRQIQGLCPNHYLLKSDESGALCVYKSNENTFKTELVLTLNIPLSDISEEAQAEVKNGICFDSLREIDEYLENAES